ncbi:MAG: flagellar biosynthesis protein FlhB [Sulfurimonas sp. RIFOXYD12_FULL_33_39]|uniref:flagellar biosynthesis protein FlhB n=1 Tax=unclassified Sulfurimonas TaxID=2623549 RepID=UPI0008BBC071|nr:MULTISPECIES: flagellar biosynthesis protein FlhB [unclassified Sulfurimonas]OHE07065.1 MAG: flagellar biosynthesis protein FlhB [Sulfurimonas sp. RIFCSPLOWO2_12_FULL_34_6]OHE10662.1 MAG: flagellar biosynthesis protein FlhB [Sulfurimonas sp. RIFOXYD12_FULL_33_39]OHE13175.1 MAG: flagellar biosynthesis protein FlhB [Sulfurimonas sp. RIFOXYD2_FULL_34_21]DAB27483.1 MAG TPA: flagellar biosynthesis protein FlhB [Sulfurimonas sp. UBA10385]
MADDAEKTEEPTSKKIEDARKEGNVPKSQDTSGVITLFVAILAFLLLFPYMRSHVVSLSKYYFSLVGVPIDRELMVEIAIVSIKELLLIIMPLSISVAIAGIIAALAQFGFLFTTKSITPDLKKIDPIKGIANLFSMKKIIEGVKVTFKSFITLGVGFVFFFIFIKELPTVAMFGLGDQMEWLKDKVLIIAFVMLFIIFIFAIVDIVIVRKQYFDGLKMSKQEIKDEMKNMDGDPLVKAKIRQIQMQASRKRMMAAIPSADVVITNPTHYAVAIKYDEEKSHAPIVVAKGMDNIALQIKKIARENGVHVVQNPPLARSLYAQVDLDKPIPNELFAAVAEVLAYVYKMNKK